MQDMYMMRPPMMAAHPPQQQPQQFPTFEQQQQQDANQHHDQTNGENHSNFMQQPAQSNHQFLANQFNSMSLNNNNNNPLNAPSKVPTQPPTPTTPNFPNNQMPKLQPVGNYNQFQPSQPQSGAANAPFNPLQPPQPQLTATNQQFNPVQPQPSATNAAFNPLQPPQSQPSATNAAFNPLQPPQSQPSATNPQFNPIQPSQPQPSATNAAFNPLQPPQPHSSATNAPFNPLQPPQSQLTATNHQFNPVQPQSSATNAPFNPLQPPPQLVRPTMPGTFNPLQAPPGGGTALPSLIRPPGVLLTQPPSGLSQPPSGFSSNGPVVGFSQPPSTSTQPNAFSQPPSGPSGFSQMPAFPTQQAPTVGFNQPPNGLAQPSPLRYPQMPGNQPQPGFSMPPQPGMPQQPYTGYGGGMRPPGPGQPGPGPQPLPQQQQPQQPIAQQQSRIDPDAIPNPIDVQLANSEKASGLFKTSECGAVPPLVTTDFICKDEGLCNPRFVRSTIYTVPTQQDMIKQSKLPMALSITPFARVRTDANKTGEVEMEPPISNLGELGPVRCKRCKAYMSPYMQFIDNGRRFQCPYCDDITPVPQEYFNHLDHMGKRVDMYERPELCLGSYEFTATKDYCRNQQLPNPPAFIFMIDVSINSIRNGLLKLVCAHIKDVILPSLPKDVVNTVDECSPIRVGFITYDKELHFYNLKNTLAAPQMMVVSDVDEIFVPILDGFLVRPSESEAVIHSLLDQLPTMFAESKETDLLLGPVIEAGIEALVSARCPGKLFIFHTNIPSAQAPGQLKSNRDDRKLLGTDKEKQILTPANDYYSTLGKKCVDAGCSMSLFLTSNQYCDLATISECLRKCAGQVYKYDFFMADTHGERLVEDLKHSIENTYAFDAVMKTRTSTGMRAVDYLGNFSQTVNDIEFAACDRTQSVCAELKHEDKLNENARVYIQVAVLYTSLSGQRRIRIHNLNFNVSQTYNSVYPNCDLDTMINYIAKLAVRSVGQSTPKSIQENIITQVANILACYRKNCANAPARGQFILPETLKLMPLFINSLLKSEAISGAKTVTTDERVFHMYRLMSMDVLSSYVYFYPRTISLLDVEDVNNLALVRCSYERFKDDGLYLIENGLVMYLWIGSNTSSTILQNLFGTSQMQQINIERCKLVDIDTPISQTVRAVIDKVNRERNYMLKLIVVRQKDTLEQFMRSYLVEDKNIHSGAPSYVDFLFQLHHEIRNILS